MNSQPVFPSYEYVVLDRSWNDEEGAEWWYSQSNEDPYDLIPLSADFRLADTLAHFGGQGFIISTSGGLDENGLGPLRIILVRVQRVEKKKEVSFLGVANKVNIDAVEEED